MTRHKRIAEIGDFEIWQAPSGAFEVYSPTKLSAVFRSEARAREWAETLAAMQKFERDRP